MSLSTDSRLRDLLELISGYGLILAVIWTPMPAQRILYWLAVMWILGVTMLRRDKPGVLGLAPSNVLRSFWVVAAAILFAAAAIVAARLLGTLHPLVRFGHLPLRIRAVGYIVWSFLQEFILQAYVLLRLLRLLPRRWMAITTAALLFSSAHIPNLVLVGLTLVWAFIACPLFLRYRNLYALGLAHGILGLCVAITVPEAQLHHMRVGLGYLRYHPHPHFVQRSSAPHIVSTQACVMDEAAILRSQRHERP